MCNAGHADALKSIKKCISGNPHMVIFNDCLSGISVPVVPYLLTGSICRLSLNNSITSLSSSIIQSATVCTSEEDIVIKVSLLVCCGLVLSTRDFLQREI